MRRILLASVLSLGILGTIGVGYADWYFGGTSDSGAASNSHNISFKNISSNAPFYSGSVEQGTADQTGTVFKMVGGPTVTYDYNSPNAYVLKKESNDTYTVKNVPFSNTDLFYYIPNYHFLFNWNSEEHENYGVTLSARFQSNIFTFITQEYDNPHKTVNICSECSTDIVSKVPTDKVGNYVKIESVAADEENEISSCYLMVNDPGIYDFTLKVTSENSITVCATKTA